MVATKSATLINQVRKPNKSDNRPSKKNEKQKSTKSENRKGGNWPSQKIEKVGARPSRKTVK
jgi:hypothetical protein